MITSLIKKKKTQQPECIYWALRAFFIRMCVIFFSYRKVINPSPAIWAAALKTHTIPFPFPTQYLSGGATASTISTGVAGAPCDSQCTGWWTLPATWWRWGRRTGPAAGSSWSRCSPSWQGQAQALSEGEKRTAHHTGPAFVPLPSGSQSSCTMALGWRPQPQKALIHRAQGAKLSVPAEAWPWRCSFRRS